MLFIHRAAPNEESEQIQEFQILWGQWLKKINKPHCCTPLHVAKFQKVTHDSLNNHINLCMVSDQMSKLLESLKCDKFPIEKKY